MGEPAKGIIFDNNTSLAIIAPFFRMFRDKFGWKNAITLLPNQPLGPIILAELPNLLAIAVTSACGARFHYTCV
jgi:hypothetical protein